MWSIDLFPHPEGHCIFCWSRPEDGKLTAEDYIPKWLVRKLPKPPKYNSHVTVSADGSASRGSQHGLGHVKRAKTLRVVCADCNNGWMSRLQNEAKPVLGPLAIEGWTEPLDVKTQNLLAKWAVMTTIVRQFDKPDYVGCPQSDRDAFRRAGLVQPQWQVYLGRYEGGGGMPKNHLSFSGPHESGFPGWRMTMTFVVGKIVFHTIYFAWHDLPDHRLYGPKLKVRAIEPASTSVEPPDQPVTFMDIGCGVGSALARAHGVRPRWFTGPGCEGYGVVTTPPVWP